MYYSNGNYEAFVNARKPKNVDGKTAYIVGSGLAGLSAAAFLVRDGHMAGKNIHIFEELSLPGGSMDGIMKPEHGFVVRGGREMENHFETLWDLFRSIPSIETKGLSVLDEYYYLNKDDPVKSYARVIENRGKLLKTVGKMTLSQRAVKEIIKLAITREEDLADVKINEVFTKEFFDSNFWTYWQTMFAFEPWASAMEMRRYLLRFVHHIDGIADMTALKYTKYNQYESLIMPLVKYLESHGVKFHYNTQIRNIVLNKNAKKKMAKKIEMVVGGKKQSVALTDNDLVFVTNGSITESSTYGTQDSAPAVTDDVGGAWILWQNLADQDKDLGRPKKFYTNIPDENWVISGTITIRSKKIAAYIEKICKKDPYSGSIVSSGPCTIKDSNWLYGFSISRQPHFHKQPKNEIVVWVYGLYSNTPGNYIKKNIEDCTGVELCAEWLYHIGVPENEIMEFATKHCNTVPVRMPYISSYFMPRKMGDRPLVAPRGYTNLAFIGNFAETERDTVFTTEYSVRTAMEAVYTLLNVERGVPETFGSCFDIRTLMRAFYYLNDKKKIKDLDMPWFMLKLEKLGMRKIDKTYIQQIMKQENLI